MGENTLRPCSTEVLEVNLVTLGVNGGLRDRVRASLPRGQVVRLNDGSPALSVDGHLIGAPVAMAPPKKGVDSLGSSHDGVVVVFGLGMGHAVRDAAERTSARVVVYEPDLSILRTVLEFGPVDFGSVPIVTNIIELQAIWAHLAKGKSAATLTLTPGYQRLFSPQLREVTEAVRMLVAETQLLETTRIVRSKNWLEHVLQNLPLMQRTSPFLALQGKFKGVPAFIVGAGPSLNKNVAGLKDAARKGVVFAVDVSGRPLAAAGVEPQVLVTLEALNLSAEMRGLPWFDRVVRAVSLSAHPDSLSEDGGPILPFYEGLKTFAPLRDLLGVPGVSVGGSVSTVAFSLAQFLGCSPIVLVGQDLAYTDGRTHAKGTLFEGSRVNVEHGAGTIRYDWCDEMRNVRDESAIGPAQQTDTLFEVPAWGGKGTVVSTSGFNAFRSWFELCAEILKHSHPDMRFVNATEGGSSVKGYEECTLVDVLRQFPDRDITSSALARQAGDEKAPLSAERISAWVSRQIKKGDAVYKAARRLEKAATKAQGHIRAGNPAEVTRSFERLIKLEADLRVACAGQPFLEAWSYADVQTGTQRQARTVQEMDTTADAEWGIKTEIEFSRAIAGACSGLRKALSAVTERLSQLTFAAPIGRDERAKQAGQGNDQCL